MSGWKNAPVVDAQPRWASAPVTRTPGEDRARGGYIDNLVRSVAGGASFGFADEIAAGMDATVGPLVDRFTRTGTSQAKTWEERYLENLRNERRQDKTFAEENPVASTVGQVAGGVGSAVAALPAWATAAAPTLLGNVAKMGAVGAGTGAVAGFGEGEGVEDRAGKSVTGAGFGGAFGAALPVAGIGARAVMERAPGRYVSEKVVSPAMRAIANVLEGPAPMKSLSAAAPDGSPGVMGPIHQAADRLGNVSETGAIARIATALQRAKMEPASIERRLGALGDEAMLADVDPQLMSIARMANTMPGQTRTHAKNVLESRDRQAGNRLVTSFEGDAPPPSTFSLRGDDQGFDQYRRAVGNRVYEATPEPRFPVGAGGYVDEPFAVGQKASDFSAHGHLGFRGEKDLRGEAEQAQVVGEVFDGLKMALGFKSQGGSKWSKYGVRDDGAELRISNHGAFNNGSKALNEKTASSIRIDPAAGELEISSPAIRASHGGPITYSLDEATFARLASPESIANLKSLIQTGRPPRVPGDSMADAGLRQSPELMRLYENPIVDRAINKVMAEEKATRAGTSRAPASPIDIMHKVKQEIADMGVAATGRGASTQSYFRDLAGEYVRALKAANPKLAEADAAYRGGASLPEFFDAGRSFLGKGTSENAMNASAPALGDLLGNADPLQRLAARAGSTNAARETALEGTNAARALARRIDESTPVRDKLGQLYEPRHAVRIMQRAASEKQFAETSNEILRGSKTADKIAEVLDAGGAQLRASGSGISGRVLERLDAIVNRIAGPNEAVRDTLGRLTLSANPEENRRILKAVGDLLTRRARGSAVGASLAGSSGASLASP